jgi:ADP-heptose:LPS heptosyltransferase
LKILLVRLRQIGDVVFTTPAIRALSERFPEAQLTYVVEPAAAPVIEPNPLISRVVVAPRASGVAGTLQDLALGRRLRRERYDIAIDFHGGPRASLLTWLSRAPVRIGYDIVGRGWMYTRVVGRPRGLRARHSVENQWDLLETLGIARPSPETFPVEMPVTRHGSETVASRLTEAGVGLTDQLVVIHVSAARMIITSGPSDRDAAAQVIADARGRVAPEDRARILDCGDFALSELRALVDRAALYIGGDSGPMHVAATSQVPMVSLYGPTLPARSAPWRAATWPSAAIEVHGLGCRPCDQRVCAPGDFRCLLRIEPQEVIAAAERLLNWTDNPRM